jgi:RNA polymerase sigma-70 factor (ECF subfamily)
MKGNPFAPLMSFFGLTDEQAMWRVQMEDDPQAFGVLVRRWEPAIQRLCARMTGSTEKGEDLSQEAFARIYARRKDYESNGKFSSYLWRVALNICYDEIRRRDRRPETSLEVLEENRGQGPGETAASGPSPDQAAEDLERAEHVRRALLELPELYRSVIVLRHYEDLKFREIAEVLDIPEGTVKSRMAQGLSLLHALLSPALAPEGVKPSRSPKLSIL